MRTFAEEARLVNHSPDAFADPPPMLRLQLVATAVDRQLQAFAEDVARGLEAKPKSLPCRYFYDGEGSHLFEEICRLPEYYLTRTERSILQERASELAALCPRDVALVELGSGSSEKTQVLIDALLRRRDQLLYVPVDIARKMLEESSLALLGRYPQLEVLALAAEYGSALDLIARRVAGSKLILWLGSNVGNFHRPEAAAFLKQVRGIMGREDRFLIGIDLRKEREVLERAYDDTAGVTARFNKNILARINRQLGGHFDLDAFRHVATYNERPGRVEMYLVSERRQHVTIDALELDVSFDRDEPVHTEDTYKYSLAEIAALATEGGLAIVEQWFDRDRRFSLNLLAVAG